MGEQVIVLRLPEELARRVRRLVDAGAGYSSTQEFIVTAIENQLHLVESDDLPHVEFESNGITKSLGRPPSESDDDLLREVDAVDQPLFVLTNRLSPMKIGARVLANMRTGDAWPRLNEFQRQAALAARAVGIRLRSEDQKAGREAARRRWVGYPVGDDSEASLQRFVTSFTLWADGGRSGGPMAILGLAGAREGRAVLSDLGWRVATLPSPVLGEAEGATLSGAEASVLTDAILASPAEAAEVRSFLEIARFTEGAQMVIDRKVMGQHPDWTQNHAAAHRGAMIGRLAELDLLHVNGRGPRATVVLHEAAQQLAGETLRERKEST